MMDSSKKASACLGGGNGPGICNLMVCDLYMDPSYRGRGLGKWLMQCLREHPDLTHTRLVFSATPEACEFYEHIGFQPMMRGYSLNPIRIEPTREVSRPKQQMA